MIRHYKKALQTKQAWRAFSLSGSRVALRVECDVGGGQMPGYVGSFNPRTPCGVRLHSRGWDSLLFRFNPRTPCGVRRGLLSQSSNTFMFQSTHSVWSATFTVEPVMVAGQVSIHALRVECDFTSGPSICGEAGFNPRTPCGVRLYVRTVYLWRGRFQSTHSVWSATRLCNGRFPVSIVSIHALRVECDVTPFLSKINVPVSIHALRVECDRV